MTSMPTHKPYMPASMGELSPDPDTKDFWDACNKGDLRIQKCSQCGKFRYPPQPGCVKCGSMKYDWMKSSGKGKVFSFSLVYHPVLPVFAEYVPYNVVVVELPDVGNVRIISNLIDVPMDKIRIGMPVELVWERVSESVNLPRFKAAKA